ncbi:diaminopimelate epimerase [Acidisphaera sp. L21]|uniref:diaminopimelate epimerase n=1 Tax=Acidisphaera sp. L21 TaxID=1641851 RepID=UPI00131A62B4|nr:diaminopimelate epimerase [Acidisphaera sp. L21]
MRVPFHKMHGAGNDFVVVDERAGPLGLTSARVAALADRHTGIGCDQFIVLGPAEDADVTMRIYNPDGGEAGACGNATRCVADLLFREAGHPRQSIRTIAGILAAEMLPDGRVRVDMGKPRLGWQDIPLAHAADTLHVPLDGDPAAASMGNPHVTFFDQPLESASDLGPRIEHDPIFPDRANVGFVQVLAPGRLRLRVWERGAGLTLACGSGACAALVNASRRGLVGRHAEIVVDGGVLDIAWRDDDHVEMTGPVATTFQGQFELDTIPA